LSYYESVSSYNLENSYFNVDATKIDDFGKILKDYKPDVTINTIGITKQRKIKDYEINNLKVNALFPHEINKLAEGVGSRFIHFSTDCVFSGKKGNYRENDESDAVDIYGRTKYLGEIVDDKALTIRTSFIGLELFRKVSIVEWFLSNKENQIEGYKNAIYTGLTTIEMTRVISKVIKEFSDLTGIYHVASEPISKYDLLIYLADKLKIDSIKIIENHNFHCDRSMDASLFNSQTGYNPPSWSAMLDELSEQILIR
jgi:dTDP-4-dehydrorhamnose reductase